MTVLENLNKKNEVEGNLNNINIALAEPDQLLMMLVGSCRELRGELVMSQRELHEAERRAHKAELKLINKEHEVALLESEIFTLNAEILSLKENIEYKDEYIKTLLENCRPIFVIVSTLSIWLYTYSFSIDCFMV